MPVPSAATLEDRSPEAAGRLLDWYDKERRDLPWRAAPGKQADPYEVWLSETMLQQTTVATVKGYFRLFTDRWPDIHALAAAPRDEVMAAWAGLGYYARARNLHKTAGMVSRELGGVFPDTEEGLRTLPGIGPYTAAAIAAIAFGRRAVVVDANIERVVARWQAIATPLPGAKKEIAAVMDHLTPETRAGDFAQAMMDLGAMICTPARKKADLLSRPDCQSCPIAATCLGRDQHPEGYPVKPAKAPRPERYGTAVLVLDGKGHVLVETRADQGMLGGMDMFPGTNWPDGTSSIRDYPLSADNSAGRLIAALGQGRRLNTNVEHVFSHFRVILTIHCLDADPGGLKLAPAQRWVPLAELSDIALPTVMRKVARAGGILKS
ncbi:A/G-specific adenine glycosylase [Alphaproteobacteria bacterium LSUCC0684]